MALIPLYAGGETIGLLQLNDSRKDMFMLEKIRFFEEIGASIGITFKRKKAEEALREERDKLKALMDGITRAGIGIDIIGVDHRILFQNETLEQRFGKIHGEPCYEHYMTLGVPCEQCPATQAVQQNVV